MATVFGAMLISSRFQSFLAPVLGLKLGCVYRYAARGPLVIPSKGMDTVVFHCLGGRDFRDQSGCLGVNSLGIED